MSSKKARKGKGKGKGGCPLKQKKNSFTAETLVQTQKGLVAISEVKIGDMVWSYNENTDQPELNEVIHLIQGQQEYDLISLILDSGETIETTADHPFYLRGKGWNPANTLKVGQALVLRNGTVVVIKEILTETRFESVYNLTVSKTHNYFVGQDGILVQNCEPDSVLILAHTDMLDKAFNALSDEERTLLKSKQARDAIRLDDQRGCYASAIYAGLITEGPRAILALSENSLARMPHSFLGIGEEKMRMKLKVVDISGSGKELRKGLKTDLKDWEQNCTLLKFYQEKGEELNIKLKDLEIRDPGYVLDDIKYVLKKVGIR